MNCQACNRECESELKVDKDQIYKCCLNCIFNINNLNLNPTQFFNLLKNGHDKNEFYLHDDFYDWDTGEALQPRNEVIL